MSGIDYSKWDKFNDASSSDEEGDCENGEHEATHRGAPEVTRLQFPTRVTVGPSGVQMASAPPKASASPFASRAPPQKATTETLTSQQPTSASHPGSTSSSPTAAAAAAVASQELRACEQSIDATDDDEDLLYERLARNGGREGQQHWWSQTEDTATVSFLVPWDTTAKMITHFALRETKTEGANGPYCAQLDITIECGSSSRQAADANEEADATATPPFSASSVMHICRQFRYPIKLTEELVEGCWQLHRMPARHLRLLVVEVFKEPIGVGMTLWWDRCFVSDIVSVVDTQTIPDRVQRRAANASPNAPDKAEQFRRVWDEAHEEFRRRMKERKARPA